MLVNNASTSRLATYKLESCCKISSKNEKESLTVYSLPVTLAIKGTRNLAKVGVPMAERIGRKGGTPFFGSL